MSCMFSDRSIVKAMTSLYYRHFRFVFNRVVGNNPLETRLSIFIKKKVCARVGKSPIHVLHYTCMLIEIVLLWMRIIPNKNWVFRSVISDIWYWIYWCRIHWSVTFIYHQMISRYSFCLSANNPKQCNVNGRIYNDGNKFKLGCKQLCTCQNGHYGCADLCPHEYKPPADEYCRNAQLVPVPGECCHQWTCNGMNGTNKHPRHAEWKSPSNLILYNPSHGIIICFWYYNTIASLSLIHTGYFIIYDIFTKYKNFAYLQWIIFIYYFKL